MALLMMQMILHRKIQKHEWKSWNAVHVIKLDDENMFYGWMSEHETVERWIVGWKIASLSMTN